MKPDFYLKQNDTWPPLRAKLLDGNNNLINIENAEEIKFRMTRYKNRNDVIIENGNVILEPIEGEDGFWATYLWQQEDTLESGRYQAEFVIKFNGDKYVTVPNDNDNYIYILIGNRLG